VASNKSQKSTNPNLVKSILKFEKEKEIQLEEPILANNMNKIMCSSPDEEY